MPKKFIKTIAPLFCGLAMIGLTLAIIASPALADSPCVYQEDYNSGDPGFTFTPNYVISSPWTAVNPAADGLWTGGLFQVMLTPTTGYAGGYFTVEPINGHSFGGVLTDGDHIRVNISAGFPGSGVRGYLYIHFSDDTWAYAGGEGTGTITIYGADHMGVSIAEVYFAAESASLTSGVTFDYLDVSVGDCPEGEPGYSCPAVPGHHFTDALSDTWTLGYDAVISDSALQLPLLLDYAYQELTSTTSSVYTVTMRAKAEYYGAGDTAVWVFLSDSPPPDQYVWPSSVAVIDIISSTYQIYTATIQNQVGTSAMLTIQHDDHLNRNLIEIDWICITGSDDIPLCAASDNNFDLDIGNTYGTILIDDQYGTSEGWTGTDYFYGSDTDAPEFYTLYSPGFSSPPYGLFSNRLLGWSAGEQTAVSYQYQMIPEVFTVTGVYPTGTYPDLEVWQKGADDQWVETILILDQFSTTETTGAMDLGIVTYDTSDFIEVITQPVYIGLAMVTNNDGPTQIDYMGFDSIQVYGCMTGDPSSVGECVFSDFDLNMDDGQPSPFWWQGTYFAQTEGATIGAGDTLYQSVLPPVAGLYNLQVVADAVGVSCSFNVRVYENGSTRLLSEDIVPCQTGIAQNYTIPLDLPGNAVEINLLGVQGQVFIDKMCLENPYDDLQCLNQNPLFALGSQYYNGDFSTSGGQAMVVNSGRIGSTGVDYNAAPPPYQLTLSLSSPDADTWVTLGNFPGSYSTDESFNISGNQTITYTFDEALAGGYGPIFFNQGPGTVEMSQYCVQHTDTYTPTTPYDCDTVTDPHFEDGDSWNYSNVIIYSSVASFGAGGVVSQTLIGGTSEASATVRLLASAYQATEATITLLATEGVTTTTFSDTISIAASNEKTWVQVSFPFTTTYDSVDLVIEGETGLEIDFVCVIYAGTIPDVPGENLPPGTVDPTLAECLPPPMGIFPPITSATWAQSIWPWASPGPDNFETVMIYNTAWVRYIGCRFDSFYKWIVEQWAELIRLLNVIIFLLGLQTLLTTLASILDAVLEIGNLLAEVGDTLADILSALLGILPLIGVLLLLIAAIWAFLMMVLLWLWYNIISMSNIPIDFINGFQAAINDASYGDLVTCTGGEFWCGFVAGIQLVNQTIGDIIGYPIVIILIVIVTIGVIWKNLHELFSLDIR